MASIAGSFSVCIPFPNGSQAHWDLVLAHWRPRDIFVIKAHGQRLPEKTILKSADPIPSARFIPTDRPLVIVQPYSGKFYSGKVALPDFEHPEDACYVFGPDDGDMTGAMLDGREPDHTMFIPTDTPHEMRSWVACAVVLYDRSLKLRG